MALLARWLREGIPGGAPGGGFCIGIDGRPGRIGTLSALFFYRVTSSVVLGVSPLLTAGTALIAPLLPGISCFTIYPYARDALPAYAISYRIQVLPLSQGNPPTELGSCFRMVVCF